MHSDTRRSLPRQRGFSYIGLLILVALLGVALTAAAELTSTALQRDREQELLFVGQAYANAIDSYRRSSPGARVFPETLEELVKDPRLPVVKRHIRRLYRDPMTGSMDWGLVRGPGNGIVGVHSKSEHAPIKQAGFPHQFNFAGAKQYTEWQFIARSLGEESGGDGAAADSGASMKRPLTPQPQNNSPFVDVQ